MRKAARMIVVYFRTAAGQRAWESACSGLPPHYRRILALLGEGASAEELAEALPDLAPRQVRSWLDELETLCFVQWRSIAFRPPALRRASGARRG